MSVHHQVLGPIGETYIAQQSMATATIALSWDLVPLLLLEMGGGLATRLAIKHRKPREGFVSASPDAPALRDRHAPILCAKVGLHALSAMGNKY